MRTIALFIIAGIISSNMFASEESKTWDASDEAKEFIEKTIVIGFFLLGELDGRKTSIYTTTLVVHVSAELQGIV